VTLPSKRSACACRHGRPGWATGVAAAGIWRGRARKRPTAGGSRAGRRWRSASSPWLATLPIPTLPPRPGGDRWGWPGHGGASSRLPGRGQARRDAAETDVVVLCGARDPPGFGAFRRREVVVVRHLGWCVSLQRFHFRQRTTGTGAWRVLVSRG
jgi:hypothetical protein